MVAIDLDTASVAQCFVDAWRYSGRPLYQSMGFADGARMDLYGFA